MTYTVPIPSNYQDINDRFTSLIMGAPDFVMLNRAVTYEITLEMMVGSLLTGIEELARRSKSESARLCYAQATEAVRAGYDEYLSGREPQGEAQLRHAHNIFRSATNKGPLWNI